MVWTLMWEHLFSWLFSNLICITTVIHLDQTEKFSFAVLSCSLFHSVNYLFLLHQSFSLCCLISFLISPHLSPRLYFPAIVILLFFHLFSHQIPAVFNLFLSSCSYSPYLAHTRLTPGGRGWQWDIGGVRPSQLSYRVPAGCVCCLCDWGKRSSERIRNNMYVYNIRDHNLIMMRGLHL